MRIDPGIMGQYLRPLKNYAPALALTTTRLHTVNPQSGYLDLIQEPARQHTARLLLARWMMAPFGFLQPRL